MKRALDRIASDIRKYRLAAACLLLYYAVVRLVFHAFCPLVILTGLPCPGCGLSRAVWFLLLGQPVRSLRMHPLGIFWLLLLIAFLGDRYLAGKPHTKGLALYAALLCAATLILYLYRMAAFFPGRAPISYTGGNLAEKWIPGYRQRVLEFFRLWRSGVYDTLNT